MKNFFCIISLSVLACACNSSKKTTVVSEDQLKETAATNTLQQSGTDFYGRGSTPVNWTLEMNYDDTIRFLADDGLSLKLAYHQLKKDNRAGQNIFTGKTTGGNFTITISDEPCTIPTEKQVYNKGVSFSFNGKTYTGCGKFLADRKLNNKWILDKIGNTAVQADDYNKLPALQFDLAKQRVSGNDGCNSIGGKIEVQGNRIKFGDLISTKMACIKKSIESIISAQVSGKSVDYYFKNDELYLYLPDDSLLVFRKE